MVEDSQYFKVDYSAPVLYAYYRREVGFLEILFTGKKETSSNNFIKIAADLPGPLKRIFFFSTVVLSARTFKIYQISLWQSHKLKKKNKKNPRPPKTKTPHQNKSKNKSKIEGSTFLKSVWNVRHSSGADSALAKSEGLGCLTEATQVPSVGIPRVTRKEVKIEKIPDEQLPQARVCKVQVYKTSVRALRGIPPFSLIVHVLLMPLEH